MLSPPEFSSLVVSRPHAGALVSLKIRGIVLALALYGAGLAALLLAPFLVLEMMAPPKADNLEIVFRPPAGPGDNRPAGEIRQGRRDGRRDARPTAAPRIAPERARPRPAATLAPPPGPESASATGPHTPGGVPSERYGDLEGTGNQEEGLPHSGCPECIGTGPDGPGESDLPYEAWTPGLTPPTLVPGTRVLPAYPDPARRAGLQGTVILLVVIEEDGSVGTIEVLRSPDQRWGFDLAAIEAVKTWRYRPAVMNGRPVAAFIQVMVEFTLTR